MSNQTTDPKVEAIMARQAAVNAAAAEQRTAITEIVSFMKLIMAPGEIVELRALKVPMRYGRPATMSGFYEYDKLDKFAKDAVDLTDKEKKEAAGTYFTLNVIQNDLLARRCNRYDRAENGELTGDQHVIRRRLLLIDADPIRISNISASDAEKALARQVIDDVHAYITALTWPAPILSDSGNGFHLLYRIDLPADDEHMVEQCLKALAGKFDTLSVKIDCSVYNPARIAKLPETWARKGDSTPERPHRKAQVINQPDQLEVVPIRTTREP